MSDLTSLICPQCDGALVPGSKYREYVCESCGTTVMLDLESSDLCDAGYKWMEGGCFEEAQAAFLRAVHEEPFNEDAWYGGLRAATWDFDEDELVRRWTCDPWDLEALAPRIDLREVGGHPIAFWIRGGLRMGALNGDRGDYRDPNAIYEFFENVAYKADPDLVDGDGVPDVVDSEESVRGEVRDSILLLQGLPVPWDDRPIEGWSVF